MRVIRSVKTAHKNLIANNRKLHKFATTNSNFKKVDYLRHASSYKNKNKNYFISIIRNT